jgi:hypothetical protein
MSNTSKTDWARIDAMSDDDIDTSDSPPLTDEFFSKAKLRIPSALATVAIRIDSETLAWFHLRAKRLNNIWRQRYKYMQQPRKMSLTFDS